MHAIQYANSYHSKLKTIGELVSISGLSLFLEKLLFLIQFLSISHFYTVGKCIKKGILTSLKHVFGQVVDEVRKSHFNRSF